MLQETWKQDTDAPFSGSPHMRSVRGCAVKTHFSSLSLDLENHKQQHAKDSQNHFKFNKKAPQIHKKMEPKNEHEKTDLFFDFL